ncbi:hypothetical protein JOE65_000374 [Arthrobacter roseus]|nr:hypothetical protein [Arthrobacter roseus]
MAGSAALRVRVLGFRCAAVMIRVERNESVLEASPEAVVHL